MGEGEMMYAHLYPRDHHKSQVEKTILFSKENLGIDLSPYREYMLEAEFRDKLVFNYLGPGQMRTLVNADGLRLYNCELKLDWTTFYFLSITSYDSRADQLIG